MTEPTTPARPVAHCDATPPDDVAAVRSRVAELLPRMRTDLERLVRIPSISNPEFDQDPLVAGATVVADLLAGAGLSDVRVLTATAPDGTVSRPAVVGRRPAPPGRPTVLLYAHHDVQPPGPPSDWDSAPFEPVERDGRLYGRGAADDKAGVVAHIAALRALDGVLDVGVTVLVEGEEEIGSPTSAAFIAEHRDLLAADLVVLADSVNWKVGVPAFTTSLRGLVDCEVEVRVLEHAVHSGMFGGPVLDAVTVLSRLIATLHDDDGEVAVAGLHSGPEPDVDQPESDFRAEASVLPGVRLAGSGTITGRLWTKPAICVTGIDAPSVAQASNTIVASARAAVSLRIAPGQDPGDAAAALRNHLVSHAPMGAEVTVTGGEQGRPWRGSTDAPLARVARTAFADAWDGVEPVDVGLGGSIPLVADIVDTFPGATVLVTGVEDPDSRAHAGNESVHLGELARVVLAEALLLSRLS